MKRWLLKNMAVIGIMAAVIVAATPAVAINIWVDDVTNTHTGDFYIYNMTPGTISIDDSKFSQKGFPSSIPSMSAGAITNINIFDCSSNSGTLNITLTDGSYFGIWIYCTEGSMGSNYYTLIPNGDTSWRVEQGAKAPSGAYSIPPVTVDTKTYGVNELEQMWNANYVVSFFRHLGDDEQAARDYSNEKIVLVISPGNVAGAYEDGVSSSNPY